MARVGHQPGALQGVGKYLFTKVYGTLLIGFIQPMCLPDMLRALHDKRGGGVIKLVNVRLKPAVLGFLKGKGKGVKRFVGAQPDVAIGAHHDIGLEHLFVVATDARINAIAGDDEIGVRVLQVGFGIRLKHQLHIELLAAPLQNVQ